MASNDFKEQLRAQADIVRIVGEYVQLRKSGAQNFQGLCPFHKEKSPSFSVHATRQFYHCFGCGESGDVFKFIQKIENLTFGESIRFIAQKLGVPMPKVEYDSPAEARQAALRARLIDINERACAWFQEQLRKPDGSYAREYLAGRGLTPEIIAKFRIGFAPESGFLLRDAVRGQFDEEVMKESGLFSWKQDERPTESTAATNLYSKFRNRVMFPISNEQGRVIAFTGRTLATDEKSGPKYLNSPETPLYVKSRVLFNLDKAKEAIRALKYVILVEGQMDCISVYAAGFHNVVATSGTAFTSIQAGLLAKHTKNVVINFDPDKAGATGAQRSLEQLLSAYREASIELITENFNIKVVTLPPGFDPDLMIRKMGRDAYGNALRIALDYFEFLIDRAKKLYDTNSVEGRIEAGKFLMPFIQLFPDEVARNHYADVVAYKLGLEKGDKVSYRNFRAAALKRAAFSPAPARVQITDSERILICALASSTVLGTHDSVSSRDGSEEGFDPGRQARFALEKEPLHHGLGTQSLVNTLLAFDEVDPETLPVSDHDRSILLDCLMHQVQDLTPELLEGAVLALRRRYFEQLQQDIRRKISEAEGKGDTTKVASLLREKIEIDRALTAGKSVGTARVQ